MVDVVRRKKKLRQVFIVDVQQEAYYHPICVGLMPTHDTRYVSLVNLVAVTCAVIRNHQEHIIFNNA